MQAIDVVVPAVLDVLSTISVTILTILLPVYVIAFSLVGPSVGRRKEELDKLNAEQAQTNASAIEHAKSALENKDASEATSRLLELENQRFLIERRRQETEEKYSSLGLSRALLYPALLLAIAAALFKWASVILPKLPDAYHPQFLLPLILAALCAWASLQFVSKTLKLIEELGRTVPEFNRQELTNVLTDVLKEREKIKEKDKVKPASANIQLSWDGPVPPFKISRSKQSTLTYTLSLTGATVANDVKVIFLCPPGFQYEGLSTWKQGADRGPIADYISAWKDHGKVKARLANGSSVKIKTDNPPGIYKCYYQIYSDEFVADQREEFEVIVE
jgi:ABC-type multidrug transport system fused ATPase/permease subunit